MSRGFLCEFRNCLQARAARLRSDTFRVPSQGLAIELYPANEGTTAEGAGTMIGFEVTDADEAASAAKANGFGIIADVKATAMGRRVIVRDPDGRQVFLFSTT
ncbi:VOC family protein [Mesorhizobium sp. M0199]|uniref:VOC family protein n=1 Tax=unclassified Mesorhizobium TaxID=325217 RepID=UPI00333BB6F2